MRKKKRNTKNVRTVHCEEVSAEEDHFYRLPEELLVSILNKVGDWKSLSRCLLVSKHFAAAVSHIQTMSVILPCTVDCGARSEGCYKSLCNLHKRQLLNFLEKFSKLESVYLECRQTKDNYNPSFPKWKAKLSDDGTKVEKFVALLPALAHKQTAIEPDQEHESTFISGQAYDCLCLSFGRFLERLYLISAIFRYNISLKQVTIGDSEKHGKLVMRNGKLFDKDNLISGLFQPSYSAKVPLLNLPSSGYIMRHVEFHIFSLADGSCSVAKDVVVDEIVSWNFEDEEKVLGEAIKEISKYHRDRIRSTISTIGG